MARTQALLRPSHDATVPQAGAVLAPLAPVPAAAAVPDARHRRRRPPSNPGAVAFAGFVLAVLALCAIAPQWVASQSPLDMQSDAVLAAPGAAHWFGTDAFGRDMFALVVYGARQSLLIGLSAVAVAGAVGVGFGLLAGYVGGWVDAVLMRVIDVWMAIPGLLLAIALATALGPGTLNIILAISLAAAPRYARVLRGQAMAVRSRAFVEAARAGGASHLAILRGHILPHCLGQIMVLATLGVGMSVLVGASLSFLGLGVNDARPDWGTLLTQGRGYMTVAWWTVAFPGLTMTLLVIAINLLGDALRRRVDPRRGAR
jgi:peptide/nickel transport system permease protein